VTPIFFSFYDIAAIKKGTARRPFFSLHRMRRALRRTARFEARSGHAAYSE
jgi:hypothetical protein